MSCYIPTFRLLLYRTPSRFQRDADSSSSDIRMSCIAESYHEISPERRKSACDGTWQNGKLLAEDNRPLGTPVKEWLVRHSAKPGILYKDSNQLYKVYYIYGRYDYTIELNYSAFSNSSIILESVSNKFAIVDVSSPEQMSGRTFVTFFQPDAMVHVKHRQCICSTGTGLS